MSFGLAHRSAKAYFVAPRSGRGVTGPQVRHVHAGLPSVAVLLRAQVYLPPLPRGVQCYRVPRGPCQRTTLRARRRPRWCVPSS
eukprot:2915759-Rhodomonas_salina.1